MISKNRLKYIRSLERKKHRKESGAFVVEGPKTVSDMLYSFRCRYVGATKEWLDKNSGRLAADVEVDELTLEELSRASFQEHPQQVIAVFDIPSYHYDPTIPERQLVLALDEIQNPGNLGTIIRIADWFGISDIICSEGTADIYNPKTVQSAMGSMSRVKVHYVDLAEMLKSLPSSCPVYGTFLDGENVYGSSLQDHGVIVMGNEGNGISDDILPFITHKLTIPNFNTAETQADSLNVAVATAVICSEFKRRDIAALK